MTNPVLEQYATGKLLVDGTLGHLTADQTHKLQQLWHKLFAAFEGDTSSLASAPLPDEAAPKDPAKKRLAAEQEHSTRSSSAPPTSRAGRLQRRGGTPSTPPSTPAASSWFGWGSKSGANGGSSEPLEYRQLVGDAAPAESLPPPFEQASHGAQTIGAAFWSAVLCDHPDVLLLRFLRARKWVVDDALAMLLACLKWRIDEQVDWAVWSGEAELNLALMRRGMGVVHKTDRIGQPVIHIPVRLNDPKAQPSEQMLDYTVYLMEVARAVLHPPVEKVCLLFDTTDMSLANMDWNFFRTFLHYLEHYYPECLGLVLIYNASWIFNGLWKLIRPLLDPVVASKVHFVTSKTELLDFIAPEHLPREFGGKDTFTYHYDLPVAHENAAMYDAEARQAAISARQAACARFEAATRKWLEQGPSAANASADANSTADASTSDDDVSTQRADSAQALVAASKALDKYVRARTLYHRSGIIGEDLRPNWNKQ
ncbi:hypothetical protein GGI07_002999 [Coemansia sp. Benny D115]|nr:hypothetical protein GGI07_002999 [Coemansia sp. Benny D115]